MKRVTGIGGVFFKSKQPDRLREWYRQHLGLDVQDWGGTVFFTDTGEESGDPGTVWSVMSDDSDYFKNSASRFMIDYRVDDMQAVLQLLREEGCDVDNKESVGLMMFCCKFQWIGPFRRQNALHRV